jgi:hypothetical protein
LTSFGAFPVDKFAKAPQQKDIIMKIKDAVKITHTLSKPGKMPGPAYSISAKNCITGAKLAKIPGSVCAGCYALKGRYMFKNTKSAHQLRQESLDHPQWVEAMAVQIKSHKWFRWHDAGDLQSVQHLNYFSVQAYARDHALAAHARSSNIKMVYA